MHSKFFLIKPKSEQSYRKTKLNWAINPRCSACGHYGSSQLNKWLLYLPCKLLRAFGWLGNEKTPLSVINSSYLLLVCVELVNFLLCWVILSVPRLNLYWNAASFVPSTECFLIEDIFKVNSQEFHGVKEYERIKYSWLFIQTILIRCP